MSGGGPPRTLVRGGWLCPGGVRGVSGGHPPPDVRGGPPDTPPRTPPGHRAPPPTSGGVLVGPPRTLVRGGVALSGRCRGGVHLGLGFRPLEAPRGFGGLQGVGGFSWRPLEGRPLLGGPWRPWRQEAWRPLEALEAPGGPWRPLEAPGGPWRPLEARLRRASKILLIQETEIKLVLHFQFR